MRIGLDIDDTICYTNRVLMKYAHIYNEEHGKKPILKEHTNNFSEVYGWNPEEVNHFFRTYYLKALEEIKPKEHVKEILEKLREEGHEIIFITVRNDRECGGENEAKRLTTEWLKEFDIPYDELHLDIHDKASFCIEHQIELFMDDSIKTDLLVKNTGIPTMIAINDFNIDFQDKDIIPIYNMNDFYQRVKKMERKKKMEYKKFQNKIIVRIDKGEEILETIKDLSLKENIKLASVSALGATNDFTVGVYNIEEKKYYSNHFQGNFEIVSLTGTINTMNDEFYTHIHMSAGNDKGEVFGGHLNKAIVSATCEMVIDIIEGRVDRFKDEETGLNLFQF